MVISKSLLRTTVIGVICAFSGLQVSPFLSQNAYAQEGLVLPPVGSPVSLSPAVQPPLLRGMKVFPTQPFRFDFVVDARESALEKAELQKESYRLIKYFLASLTVPENEIWVNLSPYEKERIIPEGLGTTEMGRDLLMQDYLLKQITASLFHPDDPLGKKFWERVYEKVYAKYGVREIPVNTLNKVWIVPQHAVVYEEESTALILESHLKVMLEEDYLAKSKIKDQKSKINLPSEAISIEIIREVIIPEIEKEVNEGKNFAPLRQIYHSLILATWYKKRLRQSLLGKVYLDQNKVKGVDIEDKQTKQKIYECLLSSRVWLPPIIRSDRGKPLIR